MLNIESIACEGGGRAQSLQERNSRATDEQSQVLEEDPPPAAESNPKPGMCLADVAVIVAGIGAPVLLIAAYGTACAERIVRLILKHPLETLLECALVIAVPVINSLVSHAISQRDGRFGRRRGILIGLSIGTSALVTVISAAALCLGYPTVDRATGLGQEGFFACVAGISCMSFLAAVYLSNRLRLMRESSSARIKSVMYSVCGAMLAFVGFAGAEFRSTSIRVAEQMAISHTKDEHQMGLQILRNLNAERDLLMEGADARTAGLPGLFIQIDPQCMRPLYFAVTGKAYRAENETNFSALPDDYLRRHVVGEPVRGLSLLRSALTGSVHPDTLSSTIDWTFVFSNDTFQDREARAEIGLPEGAVVSGLMVWTNGSKYAGTFSASTAVRSAGNWVEVDHNAPGTVVDLGRGRVLLHCYPVGAHAEMKVQLTMATPLKSQGTGNAILTLPRFIDTNFAVSGDHNLTLRANNGVCLSVGGGRNETLSTGGNSLVRTLADRELSGGALSVAVSSPENFQPVAARDPYARSDRYVIESIQQVSTPAPRDLVVVVDGSSSVSKSLAEIKEALAKMPARIHASLLLSSERQPQLHLVSLAEGLKKLSKESFFGGQDNLQAVVKAAEMAGTSRAGAVLWIHGPQPGYSKEIYIAAPYTVKPKFYEFPLDNGESDLQEFLKNHDDIGPVASIPRTGSTRGDLERFVERWNRGDSECAVSFTQTVAKPKCRMVSGTQASELAALWGRARCSELVAAGLPGSAAQLAIRHQIVTPVSLSVVFQSQKSGLPSDLAQSTARANQPSDNLPEEAPYLQGAVNGTIGPVADAVIVYGVNTAGNVRVNNLSNLESLLNISATAGELLGILGGLVFLVSGISGPTERKPSRWPELSVRCSTRIAIGSALIVIGLMLPGVINWFVGSARDCNLFS